MEKEKLSTEEIVQVYKEDVKRLVRYLPYFEGKKADDVSRQYTGDEIGEKLMSFPVYDSTLLGFVKEASQTCFMDDNYRYVYSRNGLRTHQDEWKLIERATIQDMDYLGGILSKYVYGGMTKGSVWSEAVEYGIFYRVIKKAQELVEFWDKPMDQRKA